jgi:hypothetical protein
VPTKQPTYTVIYQLEEKTMSKLILETIRDELKAQKIIDAEGEFCRDWLGKSECYLRTLRFINGEPSADALAVCASKLSYYAKRLAQSTDPRHLQLVARFGHLAGECMGAVEARALAKWQQLPAMAV